MVFQELGGGAFGALLVSETRATGPAEGPTGGPPDLQAAGPPSAGRCIAWLGRCSLYLTSEPPTAITPPSKRSIRGVSNLSDEIKNHIPTVAAAQCDHKPSLGPTDSYVN